MKYKKFICMVGLIPAVSFGGQGMFLDINNFTGDRMTLQHESQQSWKVGDLGGSDQVESCSSATRYTETNGWPEWAYNLGSIDLGYGNDRIQGKYALWYGNEVQGDTKFSGYEYSKAINEYFSTKSGGRPVYIDAIYVESSINRVDGGSWGNGIVANYVKNHGPNQDLINLTALPKNGLSPCPISKKMFEFTLMDRFARAIRNHPEDFKITLGPYRDIKSAIESGLVGPGYTFITDLPVLQVIERATLKPVNEKTYINISQEGSIDPEGNTIPANMREAWQTGLYCNNTSAPFTARSPEQTVKYNAQTSTTTKHGWETGLELKVEAGSDLKFFGGKVEKTLTLNYSGETGKTKTISTEETIKLPSQRIPLQGKECKRLTYSLVATTVSSEVNIDYEVNPKAEFTVRIYSGLSEKKSLLSNSHKEYEVHGRLIDLLNRADDGYLPPQIIVETPSSPKTSKVFIRGVASVDSKTGYSTSAVIENETYR